MRGVAARVRWGCRLGTVRLQAGCGRLQAGCGGLQAGWCGLQAASRACISAKSSSASWKCHVIVCSCTSVSVSGVRVSKYLNTGLTWG